MATTTPQPESKRGAYIVFVDEAGFMLEPLVRRTWAPRGCTPVIKVSEPHGKISVIGAMTISPMRRQFGFHFHLLSDNENFRGPSVVWFIEHLRRKLRSPITLLWDQIPIHRSSAVEDYLTRNPYIVAEPLPPYAPELNPVDHVWGYVKYHKMANYCPYDLCELRETLAMELSQVKKNRSLLKTLFKRTGLSLDP